MRSATLPGMIGQWLLGFIGTYVLVAVLGAAFWSHVSIGVQYGIGIPLALLGAGLRVRWWRNKQRTSSL